VFYNFASKKFLETILAKKMKGDPKMDTKLKARNELIAITFSHSVAMEGPYFMYVVRMPNHGYPKYYYKVLNGVSERDAHNQAFIDDIASWGDKYEYIKDGVMLIDSNIKDREAKEKDIEEDEEDEY
jgi:hypothetical protein